MSRNSGRRRWICSPFIAHIQVTISDKSQMLQAGSSNKKYHSPNWMNNMALLLHHHLHDRAMTCIFGRLAHLLQQAKKHVSGNTAFMGLINHDHTGHTHNISLVKCISCIPSAWQRGKKSGLIWREQWLHKMMEISKTLVSIYFAHSRSPDICMRKMEGEETLHIRDCDTRDFFSFSLAEKRKKIESSCL